MTRYAGAAEETVSLPRPVELHRKLSIHDRDVILERLNSEFALYLGAVTVSRVLSRQLRRGGTMGEVEARARRTLADILIDC
jgi:hypothetical protein